MFFHLIIHHHVVMNSMKMLNSVMLQDDSVNLPPTNDKDRMFIKPLKKKRHENCHDLSAELFFLFKQ